MPVEVAVTALVVATVALTGLANRLSVPYPIVLVLGGAALGFVPGLSDVHLEPDLVLVVFLPALLYNESIFANLADFRRNRRWLALNTVPLVLLTMGAVAVVAHALVPGLPWAAAFVLGAIVSPTDAVAPGTVMRRLGVPRGLISVVQGEGLFNDATALTAYRVAVTAAVAGTFSLAGAGLRFVLGALGGIAIGLAVGWVAARIRARIKDPQLSVVVSLLTGYVAYVPADAVGASGVLATVAAGLYMGVRAPATLPANTRLQGGVVWNLLDLVLNAVLFTLVGLELHNALQALSGYRPAHLAAWALSVAGVAVLVRLVWFFTSPYLVWLFDRASAPQDHRTDAKGRLVVAWSGMRGAVSLAVALAVPATTGSGQPFPGRDLIVFLTFAVILITLVGQGMTLPALIKRLRVSTGDDEAREEQDARVATTRAALKVIDALADEDWTRTESVDRMRETYRFRQARLEATTDQTDDGRYEKRSHAHQQLVKHVLGSQREVLLQRRAEGALSNDVMNKLLRELDLEESQLEQL